MGVWNLSRDADGLRTKNCENVIFSRCFLKSTLVKKTDLSSITFVQQSLRQWG